LRFPGVIRYEVVPTGGTTDFAVEIFFDAVVKSKYKCYLSANTRLPMIYMPDAIKATLDLMHAPKSNISIGYGYNLGAFSVTPAEMHLEIKKHIPDFEITYKPDHRQKIADSWSESIDDSLARKDWNWQPNYDLQKMAVDMIKNIQS